MDVPASAVRGVTRDPAMRRRFAAPAEPRKRGALVNRAAAAWR